MCRTWARFLPVVAVAALLLATPAVIPAQEATPAPGGGTPVAGVAVEVLLATIFPAERLPSGGVFAGFGLNRFEPGGDVAFPAGSRPAGVVAEVVVEGSLTVSAAGPLLLVPVGGVAESVPPGTEITLSPGDAIVRLDNAVATTLRNPGTTPALLLVPLVISTAPAAVGVSAAEVGDIRGEERSFLTQEEWERAGLGGEALTVRLERVTLAPGMGLPASTGEETRLSYVGAGEAELASASPSGTPIAGGTIQIRSGEPVPRPQTAAAATAALVNIGDTPLVLLVLTFAPAGPETATPGAHHGGASDASDGSGPLLLWPAPGDPLARTRLAGLEPERRELLTFHVHAHLDIFLDGRAVQVPAGIGVNIADPGVRRYELPDGTGYGGIELCDEPCISPLHTHDFTGMLHTESQRAEPNTLGQFFVEWGVRLDASCVGDYCRPATPLAVYVDGEQYTGNPADIVLTDRKQIAIVIGAPPAEIPATADFSGV